MTFDQLPYILFFTTISCKDAIFMLWTQRCGDGRTRFYRKHDEIVKIVKIVRKCQKKKIKVQKARRRHQKRFERDPRGPKMRQNKQQCRSDQKKTKKKVPEDICRGPKRRIWASNFASWMTLDRFSKHLHISPKNMYKSNILEVSAARSATAASSSIHKQRHESASNCSHSVGAKRMMAHRFHEHQSGTALTSGQTQRHTWTCRQTRRHEHW